MSNGGPPKEDIGPTQGWSGGPPSAPGPRTHTDVGVPAESEPAAREALPEGVAQRDAEKTSERTGEKKSSRETDTDSSP